MSPVVRFAGCALVLAGLFGAFSAVRPLYLGWGATAAEQAMPLASDSIVPRSPSQETRAITVRAPAATVWGWVTQIGQNRGGFYSYRVLENLAGCEMPDVQTLEARLQHWKVGDKLWMYPPHKAGGAGQAPLEVLVPGRELGFGTRQIGTPPAGPYDGSWTFAVLPVDGRTTRLLFRGRAAGGTRLFATAFTRGAFEPMHFAMERRTLESIRILAEGGHVSEAMNNLQVLLWAVTFACFVASGILLLAGRRPGRRLATFAAAGLVFMLLTLVQPSPLLGLPLVALLAAATWLRGPRGSASDASDAGRRLTFRRAVGRGI